MGLEQLMVAVHSFDLWNRLDSKILAEIRDTVVRRGLKIDTHRVKPPVLLVCPDEKVRAYGSTVADGFPYAGGKSFYSIEEALSFHKMSFEEEGGIPLVITPEFRRWSTRKYEPDFRLDLTEFYNVGPNLNGRKKKYFGKTENQKKITDFYSRATKIYKQIFRELRVASHPKCYSLALEAAKEEGHFGQTFVRGIRGMVVEATSVLDGKALIELSELGNNYLENTYNPLKSLRLLRDTLKNRLERTKHDSQRYQVFRTIFGEMKSLCKEYNQSKTGAQTKHL